MSGRVDYYKTLGLDPSAEDFLITAAYRALVKKYHPDVYPHEDGATRIRDIIAAYEVLGNQDKRAAYDRGEGSFANGTDNSQALDIWDAINIHATVEITSSVEIKIPPGVFLDKFVVSFLNFPKYHADLFLEQWKKLPNLHAAGFEGFRTLEQVVRTAATDAAFKCNTFLLDLNIQQRGYEISEELFGITDPVFSNIRYAGITLDQGDQRKLLRSTGEELAKVVFRATEILAQTIFDEIARKRVPMESASSIEARRQNAKAVLSQGIAGSLNQAIKSLETSIFDNAQALEQVFTALLASDGWEERVGNFCDMVTLAGSYAFFEQTDKRTLGPGDMCLFTKIRDIFSEQPPGVTLKGMKTIRQAMFHNWDVRGQILLDHCFVTFTNEILSGDQRLSTSLNILDNMTQVESEFFPGRLQGHLTSLKEKSATWMMPRAEAAVASQSSEEISIAGRIAALLLPADHPGYLAQASLNGFARLFRDGVKTKPATTIESIARFWQLDANILWRSAMVDCFALDFAEGSPTATEKFDAKVIALFDSDSDDNFRRDVYDRSLEYLEVGDRDNPSSILVKIVDVLKVFDRWITEPTPISGLRKLRAILLQGVEDLPGELMLTLDPRVKEVVSQLRSTGCYFSLGGTIAIVAGTAPENCYAFTPNGIYRSTGLFHPYVAISKVEAVQGWTQHYIKYQIGKEVFELNKLGSMVVANFLLTVIGNGMRLAEGGFDEETLNLFAGKNAAAELYLDRWAGQGQLVLVTDERKVLPASLAKEKMLLGLTIAARQVQPVSSASTQVSPGEFGAPASIDTQDAPPGLTTPASSGHSQYGAVVPTVPTAAGTQTDLQSLILDLCSRHAGKDFGFGDSIDARKLQSARKTFPMPLDLKVYGLLDATVLGTNEKGLAITANGIYWKNGWTQETVKTHLTWHEFTEIKIEQRFDKFGLGPGNFYETTGSSYPNGQLNNLLSALQASLRLIHITDDGAELSASTARPPEGATIEQVIEWACNNYSGGGIPVGSLISPKKLSNAKKEFPLPVTAVAVGLVDCTAFGSNKNGLALCTDGIYWKNDWTTKSLKSSLSWSELLAREIGSASRDVLFGPDAVVNMATASIKPGTLVAVLRAICEALRSGQVRV